MATPSVSYPGVYIVEVPSGVHTITGVATSITAFFGRATKGPLDKAVRILSLSDFARAFGGPHPDSALATASACSSPTAARIATWFASHRAPSQPSST